MHNPVCWCVCVWMIRCVLCLAGVLVVATRPRRSETAPNLHGKAPRLASVSASKALYLSTLRLTEDITRIESTTCIGIREADFAVCPALRLQGQRILAASYYLVKSGTGLALFSRQFCGRIRLLNNGSQALQTELTHSFAGSSSLPAGVPRTGLCPYLCLPLRF